MTDKKLKVPEFIPEGNITAFGDEVYIDNDRVARIIVRHRTQDCSHAVACYLKNNILIDRGEIISNDLEFPLGVSNEGINFHNSILMTFGEYMISVISDRSICSAVEDDSSSLTRYLAACINRSRANETDKGRDVMEYSYDKVDTGQTPYSVEKYKNLWILVGGKYYGVDNTYISFDGEIRVLFVSKDGTYTVNENAERFVFYTRKEWAPEVGKVYGFCNKEEYINVPGKFVISELTKRMQRSVYSAGTGEKFYFCFPINPELLGE